MRIFAPDIPAQAGQIVRQFCDKTRLSNHMLDYLARLLCIGEANSASGAHRCTHTANTNGLASLNCDSLTSSVKVMNLSQHSLCLWTCEAVTPKDFQLPRLGLRQYDSLGIARKSHHAFLCRVQATPFG